MHICCCDRTGHRHAAVHQPLAIGESLWLGERYAVTVASVDRMSKEIDIPELVNTWEVLATMVRSLIPVRLAHLSAR